MKNTDGEARLLALRRVLSARERLSLPARGMALRESAVLLPCLLRKDGGLELLYIVRRADLPTHSGQIAFPGGKREPEDATIETTALREAEEEVGLPREAVETFGMLDDVPTINVFSITPVVGLIRKDVTLLPSETEVAEVFRTPLDALVASYHHGGYANYRGVAYSMHEFLFPEPKLAPETRRIWGATARITYQFLYLLNLVPPDPENDSTRKS